MKIPMMPKGVEHVSWIDNGRLVMAVKIPMMPKGVEHRMHAQEVFMPCPSEDSYDAERR